MTRDLNNLKELIIKHLDDDVIASEVRNRNYLEKYITEEELIEYLKNKGHIIDQYLDIDDVSDETIADEYNKRDLQILNEDDISLLIKVLESFELSSKEYFLRLKLLTK